MNVLIALVNAIDDLLYQVLLRFFGLTGNFGLAIILLTLAVRLILHPLVRKQLDSMRKYRMLAPKVAELRDRFKDNPRQFGVEIANLYRAHGIRPLTGLLSAVLQAPILAGLWALFRRPNVFVPAIGAARKILRRLPPEDVSAIRGADRFLGVPLDATPNLTSILLHPGWLMIPILVVLTTYWQQHASAANPEQARLLIGIMALAIGYFAMQFPFGMSIYWIVSSVASVAEKYFILGLHTQLPSEQIFPQRPRTINKRR